MNKITLITFLYISFFTLGHFCQAQCHIDDWTALKALYESTNGGNWTFNTGWQEITNNSPSANCNLGNLYGVSINSNERVDSIILSSNGLIGGLPLELSSLSSLKYLIIAKNQLNYIPPQLSNLLNLIYLDLSGNLITVIPFSFGKLDKLSYLSLHNNKLIGNIPIEIGNLSNLTILYLYKNTLSGNIPVALSKLSKLEKLNLGTNNFSGSIPVELGKLSNLQRLDIRSNNLSGSLPSELGDLINLTYLNLHNNKIKGEIPSEIGKLSRLKVLYIYNNLLNGGISSELGKLNNLQFLNLSNNNLTGSIPAQLGNLSSLKQLLLFSNKLSGTIPGELGNLNNLTLLEINDNCLSGCYPNNIISLCTQLSSPLFEGNLDISYGNNFDATWEDFCVRGAEACEPIEVTVSTNHSNQVTITLNNNQNILKNTVATVYDYSNCPAYTNISNCSPVIGFNNKSANEALWVVTKAAEYLSTHHNIPITPVNIIVDNAAYPNDAKYNPTHNTIVLGKGDGIERKQMSAPDIVGHEYAHAVINNINHLGNYKIPGALSESYADILGELIELYCYKTNDDWIFGSQVMIDAVGNPKGLRNLSNPKDTSMKYQLPDTYKGEHWIHIDNTCFHKDYCGIHTNSGVHSYWFYLLANGGTGINDIGKSYTINGVGIDRASAIILNSLTNYLNPNSTFIDVRESAIASAQMLYADQPTVISTTMQAWDAVGVLEPVDNPIEFRITKAIQTDAEPIEDYKTLLTVEFDLTIDSLNMDISADELCFNLHMPSYYEDRTPYIKKVFEPLNREELTDIITKDEINICINRANAGAAKQTQVYRKIASKSAIIQFVVPIVVENVKGENATIEPINISGYTRTGNNEVINFNPASLHFGSDFNRNDGIETQLLDTSKITLKLGHKNCNNLGSLEVEVLESTTGGPQFIYRLKNIYDYNSNTEEIETNSSVHQFYNLEEGTYKLTVIDNSSNQFSKQFSIGFVSEPDGSKCCANNLIIPPGSVSGMFNANDIITFSRGTIISEGEFEICDQ